MCVRTQWFKNLLAEICHFNTQIIHILLTKCKERVSAWQRLESTDWAQGPPYRKDRELTLDYSQNSSEQMRFINRREQHLEGLRKKGILSDGVTVKREYLNFVQQTIKPRRGFFYLSQVYCFSFASKCNALNYHAKDHLGHHLV